jgi:pimeloyl-ACP methyl ester carboxylesterase
MALSGHRLDRAPGPWLAGLLLLAAVALGCSGLRRPVVPLRTIEVGARTGGGCLAILLPGRRDGPESFRDAGFAAAVAKRGLRLDLVAVDAHLGYYRNRSVVERLHLDVVAPARARGYRTIWVVGTSLGGVGGLLYLRDHPEEISGVLALAPFLGADEVIREIEAAGGPARWSAPRPLPTADVGRELWSWLAPWTAGRQQPPLHLGWGSADRLARANAMLATRLPRERVDTAPGGHDWQTWARLGDQFLERTALCGASS